MKNIAVGRPVTVSHSPNPAVVPMWLSEGPGVWQPAHLFTDAQIIDSRQWPGNVSGSALFQSLGADEWVDVTLDLIEAHSGTLMRLSGAHNYGGSTGRPEGLRCHHSDNGLDWTQVEELLGLDVSTGSAGGASTWLYEVDISGAGSHRFWRIGARNSATILSFGEVEFLVESLEPISGTLDTTLAAAVGAFTGSHSTGGGGGGGGGDEGNRIGESGAIRRHPRRRARR